jgi:hypothetical protein
MSIVVYCPAAEAVKVLVAVPAALSSGKVRSRAADKDQETD